MDVNRRIDVPPFGHLLRQHRRAAGLTQEELAERAGLSARGISDLERGARAKPYPDNARSLANALALDGAARAAFLAAARQPIRSRRLATLTPLVGGELFPAARLPAPPDPLVGREAELAAIAGLLRESTVRLITLTGMGGVGKTRLALQAAAGVRDAFPHGVAFIPLATITDADLVMPAIAQMLGLRAVAGRSIDEQVVAVLRGRKLLLVLDNFEQILAAAPVVARLLAACPDLTVLVTSRNPLRTAGEHRFPVPPMALPAAERSPDLSAVGASEAVRLFVARARAVDPAFALTRENAADVARICTRLDGLPLALELAAARLSLLTPAALVARLERRLPLLTNGPREAPDRLRTMRDAIAWSYDLLAPEHQALFRRLAIFVGGATLDAIAAVAEAAGKHDPALLDGVALLVEASLLQREEDATGEPRARMLETVREFALEQLAASGEEDATRRAQLAFYLEMAEAFYAVFYQPALDRGVTQSQWLDQMQTELPNLRAVFDWALQHNPDAAVRLAGALMWLWRYRGLTHEGQDRLARALAQTLTAPATAARGRALHAAGVLAINQGDYDKAGPLLAEALRVSDHVGDRLSVAATIGRLGLCAFMQGDYARAETLAERSLALAQKLGHELQIDHALIQLADVAIEQGQLERAEALFTQVLVRARDLGAEEDVAVALHHLGILARMRGDAPRSASLLAEALACRRRLGVRPGTAATLTEMGRTAMMRGEHGKAATWLQESAALFAELGGCHGTAGSLECIAHFAALTSSRWRAARLLGAAAALREVTGERLPPSEQAGREETALAVRAALGEEAYAMACEEGRALRPETALAEALALLR